MTMYTWSKTANSNATADSTINYAEGMAGKQLNDSGRALMAAVAKYRDDQACAGTTGGTATAYTITTNQGLTALTDRFSVSFVAHATNTGYATLQVDSTTAKPLSLVAGEDLPGGSVIIGRTYRAYYNTSSACYLIEAAPVDATFASGTIIVFGQTTPPTGWTTLTGYHDHALRVVNGSGYGASGGSTAFSSVFAARYISVNQLPSHSHGVSDPSHSHSEQQMTQTGQSFTGPGGGTAWVENGTRSTGGAYTGISIQNTGGGQAIDFAVQYVNTILASKD